MRNYCKGCNYTKNAQGGICSIRKANDGLNIRCVGRWAKDKYFYIGNYINLFSTAMKKTWSGNLYYIDLFSGCGKCRVRDTGEEIDGSAVMALKVKYPFKKYYFIDIETESLSPLKERVKNLPVFNRISIVKGDCNEKIKEIMKEIPEKGCLCLALIDPTGLQIKFETIKKLSRNRRVDLIVTFPEGMAIKRNLERFLKQKDSILDSFMGDKRWRGIYAKNKLAALRKIDRQKRFVELYRENLREIGYKDIKIGDEVLIRSSEKRLPLYYLLFASKHALGHKFWSIVGEIDPTGQQKFKFSNPSSLMSNLLIERPSKLNIHSKQYKSLGGKRKILVDRINDGSIIKRFDKTPYPQKSTDVVCPHFLELKWAYGCPYDCSWCYLKGTFRFHPKGPSPVIKDYKKIKRHTEAFLEECKNPEILNTGEIADSLMGEDEDIPFSKFIIPLFEAQRKHKVLFLTKASNIKHLLDLESHNQVITSFTLNAMPVADKWEKAPKVMKRLEAAHKLYEKHFEVRIRIDPMVPVMNWEKHYLNLIDLIFERFKPERITLGSLRGLQSTINGCTDKSWVKYLSERSNWGRKVDRRTRYQMYSKVIEYLKEKYNYNQVALCKETLQMWKMLKMNYKKIRCNCIW